MFFRTDSKSCSENLFFEKFWKILSNLKKFANDHHGDAIFFTVFFCHQKVTKFCSKFFLGNFLLKNGITVVRAKTHFLGKRQKFLVGGVAGGAKIWQDEKKLLVWRESKNFYLNQNQKSYVTLKLANSKVLKNIVASPPLKRKLP